MLNAVVKRRVAALIIGAVALVIGIVMLSATDVKCGGKTMREGQVCETTRNGSTTRNTFDEQKRTDQQSAYLAIGFGVVALLVGAAGFALNNRQQPRAI